MTNVGLWSVSIGVDGVVVVGVDAFELVLMSLFFVLAQLFHLLITFAIKFGDAEVVGVPGVGVFASVLISARGNFFTLIVLIGGGLNSCLLCTVAISAVES